MRFWRLTTISAAAAALLGVASGQTPSESAQTADSAGAQVQPVAAPVSDEVAALRRDLEQIVRGATSRGSQHGVLVVSLDRGDTLFSLNPDLPLAPASNMKLYSTAAALYYLGPNFRYSTYALADGQIEGGSLRGDLILYGTGDPTFSRRMLSSTLGPLESLADSIAALGITRIEGDIVGDGSYFDDQWIADGWREQYRLDAYSAPIGALSLAENVVSVRLTPGATGSPAVIRTTPATEGLLVQNRVRTVASGGSSVRFRYDAAGLLLEGQIARGHPGIARAVTVVDPGNFAAAAFRTVLEEVGVEVVGSVRTVRESSGSAIGRAFRSDFSEAEGLAPPRILATHLSPTLGEIATVTNHVSMNLFAEAMFKTAGRVVLGDGSFDAGARAVQYLLDSERPVDMTGVQIVDGSGLSPINRVTARTTVHLLDLMRRTDVWEAFYASLPQAASPSGGGHSLRNRMGGTAAARNLRAKTGTIANVSSLSGYVEAANGELLAFSIFANEVPATWQSKRAEDGIGARLARFTRPEQPDLPGVPAEPGSPDAPSATPEPSALTSAPSTPTTAAPSAPPASVPAPRPPAPPAPAPTAAANRTHRIASGETLDGIARRYDTTVAEIQRLNPGIQPRRIQPGQQINVPGAGPAAAAASTSRPATGSAPTAATAPAPAATTRAHRIANGETLDGIARRYGTTVAEIQRLNPGIQPRRIQPGQEIRVPGAGSTSAAPSPTAATRTHRVANGETLDGIAGRYDTSVAELQRLNPGIEPRRLQVGQSIRVPGAD